MSFNCLMVPIHRAQNQSSIGELLDSIISEVLEEDVLSRKTRIMRACGVRVPDQIFTPETKQGALTPRFFCIPKAQVFTIESHLPKTSEPMKRSRPTMQDGSLRPGRGARSGITLRDGETVRQFLKICSLAFIFETGNDCAIDVHGTLFMTRLVGGDIASTIFSNSEIHLCPKTVHEVVVDVLHQLDKLEEFEVLTSSTKEALVTRFKEQLVKDGLFIGHNFI